MTDYKKLAEDALRACELIGEGNATPQDAWTIRCADALLACDRERQRYWEALERLASREAFNIAVDLDWTRRDVRCVAVVDELLARLRFARAALTAGAPQEWGGNVDAENDALTAGDKT